MKVQSTVVVSGKLVELGQVEEAISKSGSIYRKLEILVDATENPDWPNVLALGFFGKAADNVAGVNVGDYVDVHCNIKGTQLPDGRRFTNVNAWKIERQTAAPLITPPPAPLPPLQEEVGPGDDDLPF
jgi:hypothetical protein